jgi:hypothetical protein
MVAVPLHVSVSVSSAACAVIDRQTIGVTAMTREQPRSIGLMYRIECLPFDAGGAPQLTPTPAR